MAIRSEIPVPERHRSPLNRRRQPAIGHVELSWPRMSHLDLEARQELLDALAQATDELGQALASLGAAYEQLDEQQADRLEEQLFRPVQRAYGRASRTHNGFASRHGLKGREFALPTPGLPSLGVKGFIEDAVDAVDRAELELVALQDSSIAIEIGDVELRSGLSEVRQSIDGLSERARAFIRTFGR
jgi:hypothetical protein